MTDLRQALADLEAKLQSTAAERDAALEQQAATADILKVIASSRGDAQPVFDAIATSANRLVGGFSTTVFRFIEGLAHLTAFTPTTPAADNFLKSLFPRPTAEYEPFELVRGGDAAQVADTENSPELREIARARGFRSMLFTPLLGGGAVIGTVIVTRKQTGAFAAHHVELLRTFADQAVIAIENAQLFDEVQASNRDLSESLQQQTATSEVLQVISNSSGDLQPVFDAMLANATRICEARFGMMWLIEGTAARCVALHNAPPAFAALRQREPVIHPGPNTAMGRLLGTKQVVHIEDAMVERAYVEGDPVRRANTDLAGARTIVAVPMLKENEVIGAIGIFHQEVRPFTDKQIQLVDNFASQAVIAIENARLLNELRQRTTELSRSLEDLRAAQDRLVQTEKLASLGQLTAGIAHEIKNPLNFVNNFAALSAELIDEMNDVLHATALDQKPREELTELTQTLKSNLQKVVQHGKRADAIVKNMLLHSREGSAEHRPADINTLVAESLNLAYHGARAESPGFDIAIRHDLDPDAGEIVLYPQDITRALLNLISNGFYAAMRRKSDAGDNCFEPVLSAATRNLGNHVEIRIRDNGSGIAPDVKEKMFNPFFTTKPPGEGTGLGLSMSHDIIVKQHDGRIDVETEPGVFTEFIVTLPRTAAAHRIG
jgi:two-component system NtrC family sensor kinase